MLVTLFGMVTVVNVIHVPNALDPMLVTGRPLIVPGMTNIRIVSIHIILSYLHRVTNNGILQSVAGEAVVAAEAVPSGWSNMNAAVVDKRMNLMKRTIAF